MDRVAFTKLSFLESANSTFLWFDSREGKRNDRYGTIESQVGESVLKICLLAGNRGLLRPGEM